MPIWIAVVLLGIIEGITEFLPVSSTGHLLIAEHWLGLHQSDLFNIVIQCGAVIAVLPLFPDRLRQFVFGWRERATQDYLLKIAAAFIITCVPMLVIEKKGFKLQDNPLPVALALVVGGVAFVVVEGWLKGRAVSDKITWPIVIAVGLGQVIAGVFPGTSRSGATILVALVLGLSRVAATEFTFLVGIPTMLAAGGWKIFKQLHHAAGGPPESWGMVGFGFLVAAVVSFIAVRWLLRYIQTHTFVVFGWYRILLAILIGLLLASAPAQPERQRQAPPPLTAPR
jgi:undecaprenyl-diphosphatase